MDLQAFTRKEDAAGDSWCAYVQYWISRRKRIRDSTSILSHGKRHSALDLGAGHENRLEARSFNLPLLPGLLLISLRSVRVFTLRIVNILSEYFCMRCTRFKLASLFLFLLPMAAQA